ncbi:homeodomain-interacting protein kinase 4-like isoform X1 [Thunnus albacares]|uniref:homeodomain-interacting protein kinase 4-like isoform X1 n=2 Tax=Thunnus albacares TaxID=8236 RepID=UPI001CF60A63|nr:homeodomain-interacting protein kinase 4-like isoform X1 [Thunnus albacares]
MFGKTLFFDKMSSSSSLDSSSVSNKTDKKKQSKHFKVQRRDTLHSNTGRYLVLDFIGEGCFGKVAKCVNLVTAKYVALKILKTEHSADAKREINMLEVVSVLDPVKKNIVWFFERFEHEGHTCLAFEMLDRSLYQLITERHRNPLSLSEIRPIAEQLLMAFDALKGIGVIHSDLKPDNIMLVNHQEEPFKVKLIDFGLSRTTSEVKHGMKIQPLGYRAPEVTLGLPLSEAIDMWGLGCVLTYLYVAKHPFAINCEYQMMRNIVEILGQPADHLLFAGKYSQKFFRLSQHFDYAKWWLKTPREYKLTTYIEPKVWRRSFKCLDDLTTLYPETQEPIELEDRRTFVGLLKCLLDMDPERRITPGEALKHPYVSMAHLADEMETSSYVDKSFNKMLVCLMDDMEEKLIDSKAAVEGTPAIMYSNDKGSAAPHSQDIISNTPSSIDGAKVVGVVNTGGSAEAGTAADGSSDQDAATTGPTKEGSAAASTGLAPEGQAADGVKDQDKASTGPSKEGSAFARNDLAPEGPGVAGAKDQDEASTGPIKEGSAADGSSDQEVATTGPTKEGSAVANTGLAPEGPTADGAKDQDEASTGPSKEGSASDESSDHEATTTGTTKEGSAAAMTISATEGPVAEWAKDQDEASAGPTKQGSAAEGFSDQEAAMAGKSKERLATASTHLAPEGPAVAGAKDQDEASTGPTKEGSATAMTVSPPQEPAVDWAKDQDVALTGLAEETAANYGSPDDDAPVKCGCGNSSAGLFGPCRRISATRPALSSTPQDCWLTKTSVIFTPSYKQ